MQIVINKSFGGFRLSTDALIELHKLNSKCLEVSEIVDYPIKMKDFVEVGDGYFECDFLGLILKDNKIYSLKDNISVRMDRDLIKIVRKLKNKANSPLSNLKIISIPDDVKWNLENYDGIETIHEIHRVWN